MSKATDRVACQQTPFHTSLLLVPDILHMWLRELLMDRHTGTNPAGVYPEAWPRLLPHSTAAALFAPSLHPACSVYSCIPSHSRVSIVLVIVCLEVLFQLPSHFCIFVLLLVFFFLSPSSSSSSNLPRPATLHPYHVLLTSASRISALLLLCFIYPAPCIAQSDHGPRPFTRINPLSDPPAEPTGSIQSRSNRLDSTRLLSEAKTLVLSLVLFALAAFLAPHRYQPGSFFFGATRPKRRSDLGGVPTPWPLSFVRARRVREEGACVRARDLVCQRLFGTDQDEPEKIRRSLFHVPCPIFGLVPASVSAH